MLFVGHATTLIELGGVRVLTDPFLRASLGPLVRHGPLPDPAALEADVVVISHDHRDHFDARSIGRLAGRSTLIVPRGLGTRARQAAGHDDVIEVVAGEAIEVAGLTVRAVPARHWRSPGRGRPQSLGYVLAAGSNGPRVYFAGDTARFSSMPRVAGEPDLALLPVGTWGPHLGPGHMGPRAAAGAARDIGAAAAVPIHWGTLYPRHLHRLWKRPLLEPGDRFAALARELAPDVEVRVLRPGESTTFEPREGR